MTTEASDLPETRYLNAGDCRIAYNDTRTPKVPERMFPEIIAFIKEVTNPI